MSPFLKIFVCHVITHTPFPPFFSVFITCNIERNSSLNWVTHILATDYICLELSQSLIVGNNSFVARSCVGTPQIFLKCCFHRLATYSALHPGTALLSFGLCPMQRWLKKKQVDDKDFVLKLKSHRSNYIKSMLVFYPRNYTWIERCKSVIFFSTAIKCWEAKKLPNFIFEHWISYQIHDYVILLCFFFDYHYYYYYYYYYY